jgi:hypothetical protein
MAPLPRNIYNFGIAGLGAFSFEIQPSAAGTCPAGYTKKVIGAGKGQPGRATCLKNPTIIIKAQAPGKPASPAVESNAFKPPEAPKVMPTAKAVVTTSVLPAASMTIPLALAALAGVGLLVFLRRR